MTETNAQKAKRLLKEENLSLVLVSDDEVITSKEKGIKPLYDIVKNKKDYTGFSVADRIVGKAAALLYTSLTPHSIYADVTTTEAKNIIEASGIHLEYNTLTKKIINRKGDDICPVEKLMLNCNTFDECMIKIENFLNSLNKDK